MKPVLVLYYSRHGSTRKLADAIAQGVISTGAEAWVRTVKPLNEGDGICAISPTKSKNVRLLL